MVLGAGRIVGRLGNVMVDRGGIDRGVVWENILNARNHIGLIYIFIHV